MFLCFRFGNQSMKTENFTLITDFVFQGFSSFHEQQITLFGVFLALYILTLAGTTIIVTIIRIDHHLNTPMNFFLSMQPISETVYTLVILPRILSSLVGMNQTISLAGSMGYDCSVAICNPLRYTVIMNKRVRIQLVLGACSIGLIVAITQVTSVCRLPFCARKVPHFFCDIRPEMKLSCIDTTVNEILTLIISVLVLVVSLEVKDALCRAVGGKFS
uniref:Olfactory receptor family 10 subfamily J member 1 n=1 Tax=Mandrillus leucophaeus TaxID=9568 RepID=A0A2K5Y5A6_MANLE